MTCHVKGCDNEGSSFDWYPELQCCLSFCTEHAAVSEPDRADWIIDLGRARGEHEQGLDATMDQNDVRYLEGLRDGGVEGAQSLLTAISVHGAVQVEEQS